MAIACCAGAWAQSDLPDAPTPVVADAASAPLASTEAATVTRAAPIAMPPEGDGGAEGQQTFPPFARQNRRLRMRGLGTGYLPEPTPCIVNFCSEQPPSRSCCQPNTDEFADYLRLNAIHVYSPEELGRLAVRGVVDPFNLLTIVGTSAISVATDPHTRYGPGMMGFAKYSGVALTQDMTNAFVETFLIPSIDHQDPLFRRMPNASLPRRVAHCLYQPFWTDSVSGKGMVNYATIVGDIVDEGVGASYVPYQRVGWGPAVDRVSVNLATTPVGNFVTEFVPDLARHINLNVVFVQRIINRVAIEETNGSP